MRRLFLALVTPTILLTFRPATARPAAAQPAAVTQAFLREAALTPAELRLGFRTGIEVGRAQPPAFYRRLVYLQGEAQVSVALGVRDVEPLTLINELLANLRDHSGGEFITWGAPVPLPEWGPQRRAVAAALSGYGEADWIGGSLVVWREGPVNAAVLAFGSLAAGGADLVAPAPALQRDKLAAKLALPLPSPTRAAATPLDGDALRRLSLSQADLPPGFISDGGELLDNAALAALSDDPAAVEECLDDWGRIDGWHVLFMRLSAVAGYPGGVSASIDRYRDAEGAAAGFAGMPELLLAYGASYYVAAEPLAAPSLGEEGALIRLLGREGEREVVHYWYRLRSGALYADVTTAAFGPEEDDGGAAAVALAGLLAERIDQALRAGN